jgi:23S rRNA pseudouridine2605 synthase
VATQRESKPSGERLQKILSQAGLASRRTAEDLIRAGRVKVNGRVIQELGSRADPIRDRITIDGKAVRPDRLRYLAFHKPAGMVSTMHDPEGRPAIGEVVRGLRAHVFPVGRLDFDSSGLIVLTNDGELAQRLTHPRYGIEKVYRVKVRGLPEQEALGRLRRGVRLEDGPTRPARVELEANLEKKARLRIAVREGRTRLVRRMCESIGHPVDRLARVAIGPLRLGTLRPGEVRDLTPDEVRALRRAVAADGEAAPARASRRSQVAVARSATRSGARSPRVTS